MENPVLIFGAGTLGKTALDIFEANGVVVYGFLDDDAARHGQEIGQVSVLGNTDDEGYTKLIGQRCEAFIAVEDRTERHSLVEMLHDLRHTQPVNAVHPAASVAASATLGHGNLVAAGAVVGAFAYMGSHCLIQAGAVLDTDVHLADFVQVGAGSKLGAGVQVGENAFLGTGVTVVPGLNVGENARVGAGSVVVENVPAGATVFGNPAKKV